MGWRLSSCSVLFISCWSSRCILGTVFGWSWPQKHDFISRKMATLLENKRKSCLPIGQSGTKIELKFLKQCLRPSLDKHPETGLWATDSEWTEFERKLPLRNFYLRSVRYRLLFVVGAFLSFHQGLHFWRIPLYGCYWMHSSSCSPHYTFYYCAGYITCLLSESS